MSQEVNKEDQVALRLSRSLNIIIPPHCRHFPNWSDRQSSLIRMGRVSINGYTKARTGLWNLPTELIIKIMEYVIVHDEPLEVSPFFEHQRSAGQLKPATNYSIIHSCSFFYKVGLPWYYRLNTFNVDIACFNEYRDKYNSHDFELFMPRPFAFENVRTVILANRGGTKHLAFDNNWRFATHFLRPFKNLREITFDLRNFEDTAKPSVTVQTMRMDVLQTLRDAGVYKNNNGRKKPIICIAHVTVAQADWHTTRLVNYMSEGARHYKQYFDGKDERETTPRRKWIANTDVPRTPRARPAYGRIL